MKIIVKSLPENFEKEKYLFKTATIRQLDGNDTIEIINSETGEKIVHNLTDISIWKGWIVFSFNKIEKAKKIKKK